VTIFLDSMPGDDAAEPLKLLHVRPPDLEDIAELAPDESPSITLFLNRGLTPYEQRRLHRVFPDATLQSQNASGAIVSVPMPVHRLRDNPGGLALQVAQISELAGQLEAKHQAVVSEYEGAIEEVNKTLGVAGQPSALRRN
jgi:hypothetical protein